MVEAMTGQDVHLYNGYETGAARTMKRILKTICNALTAEWQSIRDERYVHMASYEATSLPRRSNA